MGVKVRKAVPWRRREDDRGDSLVHRGDASGTKTPRGFLSETPRTRYSRYQRLHQRQDDRNLVLRPAGKERQEGNHHGRDHLLLDGLPQRSFRVSELALEPSSHTRPSDQREERAAEEDVARRDPRTKPRTK